MDPKSILERGLKTPATAAAAAYAALALALLTGQLPWHPEIGPIVLRMGAFIVGVLIVARGAAEVARVIFGEHPPPPPPVEEGAAIKALAKAVQRETEKEHSNA